jgi:predicted kinase
MRVGADDTRLIVIRGNSGSGKSSVARAIRSAYGRGIALVGQDLLRRVVLRDRDVPGAANIGLIEQTARYALDHGFHVVVEGMLYADRYADMLARLGRAHRGRSSYYYLDVSLEETLRRHTTRPQAAEFGPDDMHEWYRPRDLLGVVAETVLPESSTLADTVEQILSETALLQARREGHEAPAHR